MASSEELSHQAVIGSGLNKPDPITALMDAKKGLINPINRCTDHCFINNQFVY
jgi:hypothetical protein